MQSIEAVIKKLEYHRSRLLMGRFDQELKAIVSEDISRVRIQVKSLLKEQPNLSNLPIA
jgi:hypothetical protein